MNNKKIDPLVEYYGKECWERFIRSGLSFHQYFNPYDLSRYGGIRKNK